MFLHVSVILSTGGTPPGQTPQQKPPADTPLGKHPQTDNCLGRHPPGHPPGQIFPKVDTPLGRHTLLGRHPLLDRHPPLGIHFPLWAHRPSGQTPPPPSDGYCSRRYASYWNAFLFCKIYLPKVHEKYMCVPGVTTIPGTPPGSATEMFDN